MPCCQGRLGELTKNSSQNLLYSSFCLLVADAGYAHLLHAPGAGRSLKALAARLLGHTRILKGEIADMR